MFIAEWASEQNPTATGLLYSLTFDGVDLAAYAQVDSYHVSEAGSGGVSSLQVTLKDAALALTIADGSGTLPAARVMMWDYTRDLPVFRGQLERITYRPWAGVGRYIDISAFGDEALLDIIIVPTQNFSPSSESSVGDPSGGGVAWYDTPALQSLASYCGLNATSTGGVVGSNIVGGTVASSQANPLSGYGFQAPATFVTMANFTVSGSVRSAFETFHTNTVLTASGAALLGTYIIPAYFLSVDLWGGIRFFMLDASAFNMWPTDYTALTIVDSSAGSVAAEHLSWERDISPGQVTTYMYATSPAGSGWRSLNATIGRRETTGSTSQNIPTALDPFAPAINNTLAPRSTPAGRGSFQLTRFTPINAHPGGQCVITDANMPGGWVAKVFLITQIDKTFNSDGTQNWTVSFMDAVEKPAAGPASAARYLRTLTRSTAN